MIATGTALAIAAGATAGSNIAASAMSSRAQTNAAKRANKTIQDSAAQGRADLAPWRQAGENALAQLEEKVAAGPGEYTESPGYQYRLDQGVKALERGASAGGALNTGATRKALIRFGQDYGTQDYQNHLDRYYASLQPLMSLSGSGQNAAAGQAGITQRAGEGVARGQGIIGAARAEGYKDIAGNAAGGISEFVTLGQLSGGQNNLTSFGSVNRGPGTQPSGYGSLTDKPYDWMND